LFAAGRGTSRHLLSPLWRLILQWWCGARGAAAITQVVDEVVVPIVVPQRPSTVGQAAQLAAARLELAIRQAEV